MKKFWNKLKCDTLGHKYVVTKDSGIKPAKAGGCDGDSFLDGNEEALFNWMTWDDGTQRLEPARFERKAREVSHREVTFTCLRCGLKREQGRWCELGEEKEKLNDEELLEIVLENEREGYRVSLEKRLAGLTSELDRSMGHDGVGVWPHEGL